MLACEGVALRAAPFFHYDALCDDYDVSWDAKPMKYLILSDMDDTFLTSNKMPPADNIAAVDALKRAGHLFAPCTGRHLGGIPAELRKAGRSDYYVCDSGASVYDAAGTLIWSRPIDKQQALDVFAVAKELGIEVDLYADGSVHTVADQMWITDNAELKPSVKEYLSSIRVPFDGTFEALVDSLDVINRASLLALTAEAMDKIMPYLAEMHEISAVRVLPNAVEITAKGASKGSAAEAIRERLGMETSQVVAFGDSANDISMFKVAGTSVAMGNAVESCKARATFVTAPCDEAGVARGLETLGLI